MSENLFSFATSVAYVRTLSICKDNVCESKKQTYKGFSFAWDIFVYFFVSVGGFFVAFFSVSQCNLRKGQFVENRMNKNVSLGIFY